MAKGNGKIRILTREEIRSVDDLPEEIVEVPEWGEGVGVVVRGMSARERIDFFQRNKAPDGQIDLSKAMLEAPLLGVKEPELEPGDIEWLAEKSGAAIDRITRAWLRLSGIGDEALVEARKNYSEPETSG